MKPTDFKNQSNLPAAGTKKESYDRWVNEACAFLEEVGPKLNCSCSAMQSRPEHDKSPEVVFLGYNADEDSGWDPAKGADRELLYGQSVFL